MEDNPLGGITIECDVRYGSKADETTTLNNVRFTPESGHFFYARQCPLIANSGRSAKANTALLGPLLSLLTGSR